MAEATLLRGAPLAERVREEVAARAAALRAGGVVPRLAVVAASDDPGVVKYAEAKGRTAERLGVALDVVRFDPALGQAALAAQIAQLSGEAQVHGLMLALPLAPGLDAEAVIRLIDPRKDVDGLTPVNLGLIALGREAQAICPATPLACLRLAETTGPMAGRRVAVIGRGRSVGRALIPMLINRDATVTVCHTKTRDLAAAIAPCEVVFVAAGRPGLVTGEHVQPGQVVIDAGISVVDGKVGGDGAADRVAPKARSMCSVWSRVGRRSITAVSPGAFSPASSTADLTWADATGRS